MDNEKLKKLRPNQFYWDDMEASQFRGYHDPSEEAVVPWLTFAETMRLMELLDREWAKYEEPFRVRGRFGGGMSVVFYSGNGTEDRREPISINAILHYDCHGIMKQWECVNQ
jgi:hypothetical protein